MGCEMFENGKILDRDDTELMKFFDVNYIKESKTKLEKSLCLFVSFDICNSTQLKNKLYNWNDIISILYEKEKLLYLKKWKHVGDEVIYVGEYCGFKQLINLIDTAYHTMEAIEKQFKKIIEGSTDLGSEQVRLKGTIWLAQLSDINNNKAQTIHIESIDEYIGPDMDEGFRMATKTSESKLLIDPKIVYIILFFSCFRSEHFGCDSKRKNFIQGFVSNHLSEHTEIQKDDIASKVVKLYDGDLLASPKNSTEILDSLLSKIHFLNFTPLKGIWNGKPYPIFWYFNDISSCKYYEVERTDQYPISLLSIIEQSNDKQMYYSSKDLLRVFETVGCKDAIINIIDIILSPNKPQKISYVKNPVSNFYYTVACIKDNKVLVLRRKTNRRHLGNVWEFFVTKHTNIDTKKDIEANVKQSFGIDIKLLTDETQEKNIIPLHFCTVYRTQKKHNSILCCAEILDNDTIDTLSQKINEHLEGDSEGKYLESKFIGLDDICSLDFNFESLSSTIISYDAEKADTKESHPFIKEKNYSTMYFQDSIRAVISFFNKYKKIDESEFEWWKLFN